MSEPLKLLLVGPKGVGKSTAIECITERLSSPRAASRSLGTDIVAPLTAGQVTLPTLQVARLYAVPGEDCADYRLELLARDATGIAFLIDHCAQHAVRQLDRYLDRFTEHLQRCSAVVGVTHIEQTPGKPLERYHRLLTQRGLTYPVFPVDARESDDVLLMIQALLIGR